MFGYKLILSFRHWTLDLWKIALLTVVPLIALAACNGDPAPTQPPATQAPTAVAERTEEPVPDAPAVKVVSTTNIVADWVQNIGGEHVEVFSLLPIGVDPHSYQPGAQDVARIADADLVLSIGLGLEEAWLHELVESAARDESSIVELAELIDPIEFGESHIEDVELIEEISHIVHEVEEGEISPEEGLEEIKEYLESIEGEDHGDEGEEEGEDHGDEGEEEGEDHGDEEGEEGEDHGDEEGEEEGDHHGDEEDDHHGEAEALAAMILEIVNEVEEGHRDAEDAIEAIEGLTSEGEEAHEGHGHGTHDPHFWFDPIRVKTAVNEITSRLAALDPGRADAFMANAEAFNDQLDELHAWTEDHVTAVPEDRRLLITSHDSLGYFATLYGFNVIGVVLAGTTEVEPSPEDLADLIEVAIRNQVPAVFGETTVSERLANVVATESGAELVRLYSGSLDNEGTSAATYLGMVRTNVERIVEALQ